MAKNDDEINLRRLINIGKDKGYITYQELNEDLSNDIISSEEIDDLLQMFEDLNIKVVMGAHRQTPCRFSKTSLGTGSDLKLRILLLLRIASMTSMLSSLFPSDFRDPSARLMVQTEQKRTKTHF